MAFFFFREVGFWRPPTFRYVHFIKPLSIFLGCSAVGLHVSSHQTSFSRFFFCSVSDHRSQDTVYIGVHFPRPRDRRHRRHKKHHSRHAPSEANDLTKPPEDELSRSATPPSQRVQFLLGDEEDEEHRAHDIFCEMDELQGTGEEMEWKETARWIKFEEDVEEGGERWSKPHVATLSLHSLFELRCSILSGTVILDMEATTMQQLTDLILDNLLASKQLEEELRDKVREALMCRHHHQHEKRHKQRDENGSRIHLPIIRSLADIGKKYSEPRGLVSQGEEKGIGCKSVPNFHRSSSSGASLSAHDGGHGTGTFPNLLSAETGTAGLQPTQSFAGDLTENASSHKINLHFMKKIPQGAEASNIMVGEVEFLNHPITAFVRLSKSVLLADLTEVPVPTRFLYILLGPVGNAGKYHEIGRSIATLMSDEIFHDVAYKARNRQDLVAGIDEFLDQVTVLPPGEWDPSIRIEPPKSVPSQEGRKTAGTTPLPNGKLIETEDETDHCDPTLMRTGRFFGGLIDDIRRKIPVYASDFKDALHIQCAASFIFLYFACLTPIITFGGLLGDATKLNMAALESIFAGSICGIVYALCAGQPLTILGSTGPVLVFETIVHSFCFDNGLDYLSFRLWIGLWTGLFLIIIVAFDLSALVRYITRFTEESFAALISLIFIKEALAKCIHIIDETPPLLHGGVRWIDNCYCGPPKNATQGMTMNISVFWSNLSVEECRELNGTLIGDGCRYVPDVFFCSVLLFIGTFTLAMALKAFRNTRFFPTRGRSIISDFAVIIAIVSMIGLDLLLGVATPKLQVPDKFQPTNPGRKSWFIHPLGKNPWWTILAAVLPALLGGILIFMDQQITAVIVNRKENKLKKGHGYHLDLMIVATLIIICSILGLPWFVAATVLSITHVMSLKVESECTAPGERPKFLGVREQRVTGVMIFLTIGLSVFLTSVLRYIPMPVLYGVFLYMGVSSLKGMQLVSRTLILFMPQKYQPDYMYLRHVRTKRVHIFTLIQIICLVVLWVIKTIKSISIAFPIMVLAMCFVRKGLDWIFTQRELKWLDDIMPESHRRAKEDQEKIDQEQALLENNSLPLFPINGNVMLPVEKSTLTKDLSEEVNISEEMSKTAIWKTIVATDSNTNIRQMDEVDHGENNSKKKKKRHSKKSEKRKEDKAQGENGEKLPTIPGSPKDPSSEDADSPKTRNRKKGVPVTFYIDDEEKEQLIRPPEIVVDPPSDAGSLLSSPVEPGDSKA
ncbi:electroneutral sodium bicarbonate exchanger 1-like isoform X3 [Liolophura sinensis]|uniref:electroneutral sodium bicarbonate exchanger 1-like isoform X3 n=1 Tax=Liolophura sinensis TaxID=3198878 RepID=UPI003158E7DB